MSTIVQRASMRVKVTAPATVAVGERFSIRTEVVIGYGCHALSCAVMRCHALLCAARC